MEEKQIMDEVVKRLQIWDPSEMFAVSTERLRPMVHMPYNDLIDLFWDVINNVERLHEHRHKTTN